MSLSLRASIAPRSRSAILISALWIIFQPTIAEADTQIIAITGDPVPDGNGVYSSFDRFREPVTNNAGQVAFWAKLADTSGGTSDDESIFLGSVDTVAQIARRGQTTPDGNGQYEYLGGHMTNDAGQVAFWATLTGTSGGASDNGGVFLGTGQSTTQILRKGQTAPDGNGFFSGVGNVGLNDAGQVLLDATLEQVSGVLCCPSGVYVASGGPITEIARQGQPTPDGNGTFGEQFTPVINEVGEVAYWNLPSSTISNNGGIYRGSGGPIAQIAFAGQPAPDGNGVLFGTGAWSNSLGDDGRVAFWANFESTSGTPYDEEGIFIGTPDQLIQVARAGQSAPDGNRILSWVSVPALNSGGQVAFEANLADTNGGTSDNQAIFLATSESLTQVARKGQPAPDDNGILHGFVSAPTLNEAGQVAFLASLIGTSGGSGDDRAIYLTVGAELLQIAREGQSLAGSSIIDLSFGDLTDEENGLNDAGQVSYWAKLADGREVIALWTPPLDGDFNSDGTIDAADYVAWRKLDSGSPQGYSVWREHFGEPAAGGLSAGVAQLHPPVPEPTSVQLLLCALIAMRARNRPASR